MTIACITDQHLDGRKSSQIFWEFFMKFYNDVFFPTLLKKKIKTVIDLGDTFDNRKGIDLGAWHRIKTQYYDTLEEMGITVHMIVGNHTAYYKNTNKINTPELLLNSYKNIHIYSEVTDIEIEGLKITMLPWINSENKHHVLDHLQNTDSKVIMGHLELNGFVAHPGHVFSGGTDANIFSKFDKVFSGHFHHKSEKGNIKYLGNPYELYWNDCGEQRGFHLLDPKTVKTTFIQNPYKMFRKIFYNDLKTDYKVFNIQEYKNSYIKVIVEERTNPRMFEQLIERLYDVGIHDLKIIEDDNFNFEESSESLEYEDTLTTLNRYIEETDISFNKTDLKSIIKSIYVEACELH
jgi:DNA repair exonuclease SbcCD nuclease subunit